MKERGGKGASLNKSLSLLHLSVRCYDAETLNIEAELISLCFILILNYNQSASSLFSEEGGVFMFYLTVKEACLSFYELSKQQLWCSSRVQTVHRADSAAHSDI